MNVRENGELINIKIGEKNEEINRTHENFT